VGMASALFPLDSDILYTHKRHAYIHVDACLFLICQHHVTASRSNTSMEGYGRWCFCSSPLPLSCMSTRSCSVLLLNLSARNHVKLRFFKHI
jgi:hypothetical protein